MRQKRKLNSIIPILAITLFVCGMVNAAESASTGKDSKAQVAKSKPQSEKKPVSYRPFRHSYSQVTEAEFTKWLEEFYPKEAESLASSKATTPTNPKLHENKLRLLRKKYLAIMEAYKINPEFGKALMDERELISERISLMGKLKAAKKEEAKKYYGKLAKIVSNEFDINVKIKRFKYEGLRARIKRMEQALVQREMEIKKLVERKDTEIKNRLEELLKNEEKINWK